MWVSGGFSAPDVTASAFAGVTLEKAVLVLKDDKSKGARKTESVRLETHSQMLEQTRRIHDLVQFGCMNKTSKEV